MNVYFAHNHCLISEKLFSISIRYRTHVLHKKKGELIKSAPESIEEISPICIHFDIKKFKMILIYPNFLLLLSTSNYVLHRTFDFENAA